MGEAGAVEGQNVVLVVRIQGSILGGEGCVLGCRGSLGCRALFLRSFRCRGYGSGSLILGRRGHGGRSLILGGLRCGGSALSNLEGGDSYEPLIGLTLRVAYSSQCVGCACGQLACLNSEGGLEGAVLNLICRHRDGSDSIAGDLLVCIQCVDADLNAGANLLAVEAGSNNTHGVELCITGEVSVLNNDGGVSLLCLGGRGCRSGGLGGCRSSGVRSLCLGSLGSVCLRSFSLGCFGCLSLRSLSSFSLGCFGCLSLGCFGLRSLSLGGLGCIATRQGRSLRRCLLINNLLLLIGGCFCRKGCRDCCHRTSGKSCRSCDLVNATGSLRHFSSISDYRC